MNKIETEAWVLHDGDKVEEWESYFKKEPFTFDAITDEEVLVEPIFGGWEANMSHAINRNPVNVCRKRGEPKVVLGNSGLVRVLDIGSKVGSVKKGDLCAIVAMGHCNRFGVMDTDFGFGFDQVGSIGLLAKKTKVFEYQLIPVPENSKLPLRMWSFAFVRFGTAWSNWIVTSKSWEAQMPRENYPSPYVFGWGGGTTLGGLLLAKKDGYKVAMTASSDERLKYIESLGIIPVDRRQFIDLNFDPEKYDTDRTYRKKYFASLNRFRKVIHEITEGEDVSVFLDNIGAPVYPATLRVLARPGIISTSGWKKGMNLEINRALECHHRHTHVFTHGWLTHETSQIANLAAENEWIPEDHSTIYGWDEIPQLVKDYAEGKIDSYFPTYQINTL